MRASPWITPLIQLRGLKLKAAPAGEMGPPGLLKATAQEPGGLAGGQGWGEVLALFTAHTSSLCRDLCEGSRELAGVACSVDKDPRTSSCAACSPWAPVMVHSEPRADLACPQAHHWNAQTAHGPWPRMTTAQARATPHTERARPPHPPAAYVSACVQLEIGH